MPVLRLLRAAGVVAALSLATALAPVAGHAQPASTLVVGLSGDITSLDPHFHNVTPNANVAEHMFETLIAKDEKMRLEAGPRHLVEGRGRYGMGGQAAPRRAFP